MKNRMKANNPEPINDKAVEILSGKMIHEIGNFLNNIDMVIYGLKHERLSPRGKKILEILGKESGHVKRFIMQFRRFARMPQPNPQRASLEMVIRNAVAACTTNAGDCIPSVDIEWPTGIPAADIDPALMGEAMEQLIGNGIDAASPSGKVLIQGENEGDHLRVTVSDSGAGIAPEILDHLFEPFFTTKAGTGSGLGLAIARAIIEAHGGSIDCESPPESGALFIIRIPISR